MKYGLLIWLKCNNSVDGIKVYRYLLMVIDVFSKYGWIVPLKDKKGESVTKAFSEIFKEGRKPQYLWVDKGKGVL